MNFLDRTDFVKFRAKPASEVRKLINEMSEKFPPLPMQRMFRAKMRGLVFQSRDGNLQRSKNVSQGKALDPNTSLDLERGVDMSIQGNDYNDFVNHSSNADTPKTPFVSVKWNNKPQQLDFLGRNNYMKEFRTSQEY
jgi:hypothetical protein